MRKCHPIVVEERHFNLDCVGPQIKRLVLKSSFLMMNGKYSEDSTNVETDGMMIQDDNQQRTGGRRILWSKDRTEERFMASKFD